MPKTRVFAIGLLLLTICVHPCFGGEEIAVVGTWDGPTCGQGADVWGEGDLAFWAHFQASCVDILDVSNPAAPLWLSSIHLRPPDDFASAQDVKVHDGLAFVAHGGSSAFNAASIVDVRNPSDPALLTVLRIEVGDQVYNRSHNLFYHGGYLYLVDSSTRTIAIIDLTNYDPDHAPGLITQAKWQLTNVGTAFVHDITVQGNRLYALAWDSIIIYDITNIANEPPVFLGSAPGDAVHSSWATDDGQYVVVAEERSGGRLMLFQIVDSGEGLNLVLLDQHVEPPPTFSPHNPLIVGDRVYTAWYASGMIVHEIDRDAGRLVEIGRINPGSTWGVYPFLGLDRVILGGFGYFAIADATLCAAVSHDSDNDADVDLIDFAAFQRCVPTGGPGCVESFDADCDGVISPSDFASFFASVTGP